MRWGEEDKSLEWIVYDTLEKENKELKARIQELETKNEKLRDVAEDAYDWAVLHGTNIAWEGKGVWYRLKQALEKNAGDNRAA